MSEYVNSFFTKYLGPNRRNTYLVLTYSFDIYMCLMYVTAPLIVHLIVGVS